MKDSRWRGLYRTSDRRLGKVEAISDIVPTNKMEARSDSRQRSKEP
jgi:hypothetical protein